MKKECYVYKLFKDGVCVYVGMAEDARRRIYHHLIDKDFDEHCITGPFQFELARAIERRDILKFKPKYNKEVVGYRSLDAIFRDLRSSTGDCIEEDVLSLIEMLEIDVVDMGDRKLIRVEDGKIIRSIYKNSTKKEEPVFNK